jgi:hypothetical protein
MCQGCAVVHVAYPVGAAQAGGDQALDGFQVSGRGCREGCVASVVASPTDSIQGRGKCKRFHHLESPLSFHS